jgi:hypothetical protein
VKSSLGVGLFCNNIEVVWHKRFDGLSFDFFLNFFLFKFGSGRASLKI